MPLTLHQLKVSRSFLSQAYLLVTAVSWLFFGLGDSDTAARMNDIATRIEDESEFIERLIAKLPTAAPHPKKFATAAPVAQRMDHLASDQAVGGSSPSGRTILNTARRPAHVTMLFFAFRRRDAFIVWTPMEITAFGAPIGTKHLSPVHEKPPSELHCEQKRAQ